MVEIKTRGGILIANDYIRVVHGGRGDYVEFSDDQIIHKNMRQILKNTHEMNGFYDEYRTSDDVKVYHQFGYIGYADYKIGMWYISPDDLDYIFPQAPMKLESFIQENARKEAGSHSDYFHGDHKNHVDEVDN